MTPPLDLISPVGSNFLKDFPAQNATNCDRLDTLAGQALTSHSLSTYTPVLKGSTTDPTLGTGGYTLGVYYRIWDWVYTWGEFRFGTAGINVGSGIYSVTLPFNADNNYVSSNATPARGSILGESLVWDDSTDSGKRPGVCQLSDVNTIVFYRPIGDTNSEFIYSGGPITWAINDGVAWSARYRRI